MRYRRSNAFRCALVTAVFGTGVFFSPFSAAQEQQATLPELQVVLLIDQSGSLSEGDIVAEKEAARTIAASALSPGSVVSVIGFGSAEKTGQTPVDVVCQLIHLDTAQQRDTLAKCIGDVHKRRDDEGAGTDHAAALQQALSYVSAPKPDKKVVFLLTDGKLDVSGSPSWGDTAERRNAAANDRVQQLLGELDRAGAQVWPLGFGQVDLVALRGFAKGKSCTPGVPDPKERVVPNVAELREAVAVAFSSASCVKYNPPATGTLPPGGSVELKVDIPAVASDASILVYKRHKAVRVEYLAPGATRPAPHAGGASFEFAGQSTETESVLITDPEPGTWTIKLSSSDIPAQEVAATVVYQAAVKATLAVSPPQPSAGQTVKVDMNVRARGRAVIDRDTLQGLTFVTSLTGSGTGFATQTTTLADPDGDGTFTGELKVPDNASGDLTFTGKVTGIGVGGDTRTQPAKVLKTAAAIQAQILFDPVDGPVRPGGEVTGTINVTNDSGQSADLRLKLDGVSEGAAMTITPATAQAGTGTSKTAFSVRFGENTRIGTNGATVTLLAAGDTLVDNRLLSVPVEPEPGLFMKLIWLWVVLAAVAAVLLVWLLLWLRARNAAGKTRGLRAQLWQGGFATSELEPRDPDTKVFRFVLHDDITGLQLQDAGSDESGVYEVRRTGRRISLTPPDGQRVLLNVGERHDIGRDLAVAFADERGTVGTPLAGPPAELFRSSSANGFAGDPAAPPSNPFEDSGPTLTTPTDLFGGSASGDRKSYVDPNNPFA